MMNFRKQLIVLCCLLLGAGAAQAQEMQVVDFRQLDNDLTANLQGTSRQDQFGQPAALIKIASPGISGLVFDGGQQGIVDVVERNGETWLYVPQGLQRLSVSHRLYGRLDNYVFSVSILSARTYEMLLDVGTGRFVNINTTRAGADVVIDGQPAGRSPVVHHYLPFGSHTLRAVSGRYEGEATVVISNIREGDGVAVIQVDMHDTSDEYGSVTVTASDYSDIYFDGQKVGTGRWQAQLRQGTYQVETRRPDHLPRTTDFEVQAQQECEVQATLPVPMSGYLRLVTSQQKVTATCNGTQSIALNDSVELAAGNYQLQFSKRGYRNTTKEYTIHPNRLTTDTVQLKRGITFYATAGLCLNPQSGTEVWGEMGYVYKHNDFSISGSTRDGMSSFELRYGRCIELAGWLTLTPMVGVGSRSVDMESDRVNYDYRRTALGGGYFFVDYDELVANGYEVDSDEGKFGVVALRLSLRMGNFGLSVEPCFRQRFGSNEFTDTYGHVSPDGFRVYAGVSLFL